VENEETSLSDNDSRSASALYLSLLGGMGVGRLEPEPRVDIVTDIPESNVGSVLGAGVVDDVKGASTFEMFVSNAGNVDMIGWLGNISALVVAAAPAPDSIRNESSSVPPKNASNLDGDSETLNLGGSNLDPALTLKL